MPVSQNRVSIGTVQRVAVTWTGDSQSQTIPALNGVILRVQFIPGTGGNQPNSNYDVTLTDSAGQDVLAGQGANLSNSTVTSVCPGVPLTDGVTTSAVPIAVAEDLTLNVSNAGASKTGTVVIYLR